MTSLITEMPDIQEGSTYEVVGFFKECHLNGKNLVLIISYVDASQSYHQLKPEDNAGDGTNSSSSLLNLVMQFHFLTANTVVSQPHTFQDTTDVSGQNPPVPLSDPIPCYDYSANSSQRRTSRV